MQMNFSPIELFVIVYLLPNNSSRWNDASNFRHENKANFCLLCSKADNYEFMLVIKMTDAHNLLRMFFKSKSRCLQIGKAADQRRSARREKSSVLWQ